MSQRTLLKARGLFTDSNQLGSVPEGAMTTANNVIIDRDDIVESRRGFSQFGNTFGASADRANQLISYKDRILIHNNNTLLYNDNSHENNADGNFLEFSGIFSEVETGRRLRASESNKNLYFTTDDGVKKISAKTAADFTTAADFIIDAGAAKALDVTGDLVSNADGYLPPNSEVAYRIVWGYKDNNDNLLLGSPSSRLVVSNVTQSNANVNLSFVIPDRVDTSIYFYQVYRTAVVTLVGSLTFDIINSGDEMQLVIEDFVTTSAPGDTVSVGDIAPEDFRQGGVFLYTNNNSGDGIDQANEPPPKAKDITMYQSTLFYGNTESKARKDLGLLTVNGLISGTSSVTIDDTINPAQTYTFQGGTEVIELEYGAYSGAIPTDLDGKYCLINSAGDKRKYYVWYDDTKTTQTLDFTNYIIGNNIEGKVIVLYTPKEDVTYYVWYDKGTTIDPGSLGTESLLGMIGIPVDISTVTTKAELAHATQKAICLNDINGNFDIKFTPDNDTGVSVTFGTPTEIESTCHNLSTGDSITISNSTTTPNIDGVHVITRVDTNNFTIAVATSADGTIDWTSASSGIGVTATLGNPTLINSSLHGLKDGDSVVISNSTTTPDIDNTYQITKIDNNNFSIDIQTTISGICDWNSADTIINIESESFDLARAIPLETVQSGFSYTAINPINSDPANDLIAHADVIGRTGLRVNISRNVTTAVHVADATAAAILDQDTATDFDITYTSAGILITLETTNNGNTEDAIDGVILSDTGVSVTLGNPTSINSISHGLKTGDYVAISNSTTTPLIDGSYTVTKVDDDNFTIPVTTTVGGICDWDVNEGIGNGFTVTVTQQGIGEDSATNKVLLSAAASPAQQIDETARSLVNIINRNPNGTVYAFYISGASDLPGLILFESRDIGINQFTITANSAATGDVFNPSLPPSVGALPFSGEVEVKPNRVYYAKLQQPEAVPLLNFIDIGPEDKEIQRILSLRESLFVLKDDGVYRLTGSNGVYAVDLFDESTKIIAPDSAVVLNNQIYCLTNQGIAVISDTGVSIISKDIDDIVKLVSSSGYDFKFNSFGVSYETDRSYLLWLPSSEADTVATQCLRYSTTTNSFTIFPIAKTCGLVNQSNDKLYLGTDDENFIEQERKLFDRTDYADRDFALSIPADSVSDTILKLSTSQNVNIGDAVVQTQNLTISEFNQLVARLDLDPGTDTIYSGTYEAVAGDNMKQELIDLAQGLDLDTGVTDTDYTATVTGFGSDFAQTQLAFNAVIDKLNLDAGVFFQNYDQSTGTEDFEVLVIDKVNNITDIVMQYATSFIEGPITLYKGIDCDVVYSADAMGDTSVLKHVREGTFVFENNNFSRATVGYSTDLSPGFQTIDFTKSGKGDWGLFIWGNHNWGGGFSGVPLRTYIPRQKQRCRFIKAEFIFNSAREKFALYGITYTLRMISEKAWK